MRMLLKNRKNIVLKIISGTVRKLNGPDFYSFCFIDVLPCSFNAKTLAMIIVLKYVSH